MKLIEDDRDVERVDARRTRALGADDLDRDVLAAGDGPFREVVVPHLVELARRRAAKVDLVPVVLLDGALELVGRVGLGARGKDSLGGEPVVGRQPLEQLDGTLEVIDDLVICEEE